MAAAELGARIAALERELEQARRQAVTDELTGCLNHRGWQSALEREERPRGVVHRTRAPRRTTILMVKAAGVVPTGD